MKFTITIEREDGTEIDVQVEAFYFPGHRGARDTIAGVRNAGPPLEPDEPASFEILKVFHNGRPLEVSESVMDSLTQQAWEHWSDPPDRED